jgi:hypothetical protein
VREAAAAGDARSHADRSAAVGPSHADGRTATSDGAVSIADCGATGNSPGGCAPRGLHAASSACDDGAIAIFGGSGRAASGDIGLSAGPFDLDACTSAANCRAPRRGLTPRAAGDGDRRTAGRFEGLASAVAGAEGGLRIVLELTGVERVATPSLARLTSLTEEIIELPRRGSLKGLAAAELPPAELATTKLTAAKLAALSELATCTASHSPLLPSATATDAALFELPWRAVLKAAALEPTAPRAGLLERSAHRGSGQRLRRKASIAAANITPSKIPTTEVPATTSA